MSANRSHDRSHDKSYEWFLGKCIIIYGLTVALGVSAAAHSGQGWKEFWSVKGGDFWLMFLFAIPFVVQMVGLFLLHRRIRTAQVLYLQPQPTVDGTGQTGELAGRRDEAFDEAEKDYRAIKAFSKFYLRTMALCLPVYTFLWLMYACGRQDYKWDKEAYKLTPGGESFYFVLSIAAIIAIIFLLLAVIAMTYAIIAGTVGARELVPNARRDSRVKWLNPDYLKKGASQAPFLALIFFLTIFLGVSYLFGFALAFHDKTQPKRDPALVMRNQAGSRPTPTPNQPPTQPASPTSASTSSPSTVPTPDAIFHFGLGESSFKPDMEKAEWEKIITKIKEETRDDKPVRVTIIGKTDLLDFNATSHAYQSNYELAEARAQYVKWCLMSDLSLDKAGETNEADKSEETNEARAIEWVCLSEPKAIANEAGGRSKDNPNDRVVTVNVNQSFEEPGSALARANHHVPLNLMDYVYFANYTITTTGYGDIIPNTVYTKFICSFANICEVFFMVVLFNSLLSLRASKVEHEMPHTVEDMSRAVEAMFPKLHALSEQVADVGRQIEDMSGAVEEMRLKVAQADSMLKRMEQDREAARRG